MLPRLVLVLAVLVASRGALAQGAEAAMQNLLAGLTTGREVTAASVATLACSLKLPAPVTSIRLSAANSGFG